MIQNQSIINSYMFCHFVWGLFFNQILNAELPLVPTLLNFNERSGFLYFPEHQPKQKGHDLYPYA